MAKLTALIPARGGSKGVPRKNIKLLGGLPLLSYSIATCLKCVNIDRVIVSTEDEEIANISRTFGAEVPFIRPLEFARDDSPDYGVIKHFFSQVDAEEVVLIRPTTPLRDDAVVDTAIAIYRSLVDITSMRSMHELAESPYKFFKIDSNGLCEGFFDNFNGIKNYTNLPRQTFPKAYHPNGYVDIIKRSTIDAGSTYGEKISPFFTDAVVEVDTKEQFDLLELYLTRAETRA